ARTAGQTFRCACSSVTDKEPCAGQISPTIEATTCAMDNIAAPSIIEWYGPFKEIAVARQSVRDNIAGVDDARNGIYLIVGHPINDFLDRVLWRLAPRR